MKKCADEHEESLWHASREEHTDDAEQKIDREEF